MDSKTESKKWIDNNSQIDIKTNIRVKTEQKVGEENEDLIHNKLMDNKSNVKREPYRSKN